MPSTPQHDDVFRRVAEFVTANRAKQSSGFEPLFPTAGAVQLPKVAAPEREQGWNLGQGFIDALSSGSYAVAGLGQKIGENVEAIGRGEVGAALDLANPFSALGALGGGIQNRRTWAQNLTDWGMEEGADTGIFGMKGREALGLALDIALDPFWLIPGGAIATGIKATAKGSGIASAATKGGVQLTGKGFEGARKAVAGTQQPYVTRNIGMTPEGITVPQNLQEFFPQGAKTLKPNALSNLIEGVKQTNADEYAAWAAARRAKKAAKKGDATTAISGPTVLDSTGEAGIKAAAIIGADSGKVIENLSEDAAAQASSTIVDSVKASDSVDNIVKEADLNTPETIADKVDEVTGNPSVYKDAQDAALPVQAEVMAATGKSPVPIDTKKIEAPQDLDKIAKAFDEAPEIDLADLRGSEEYRAAYLDMRQELREQYDAMLAKGVDVELVDYEPYMSPKPGGAEGELAFDARLMLEDIANNRLLINSGDLERVSHPIMNANDMFLLKATHAYYGHGAAGRGATVAGKEAAWASHATMFNSLAARRAFTTEIRAKNSYKDFFGTEAPNKMALIPEEFTLLPDEAAAVARYNDASSFYRGVTVSAIDTYKDSLLDTLSLVASKTDTLDYSKADLDEILEQFDEIVGSQKLGPSEPVSGFTSSLLKKLADLIAKPTATRLASPGLKDAYYGSGTLNLETIDENTIMGVIRRAADAFDAKDAGRQVASSRALAILHQLLDEPVDATELLESALRDEGRLGALVAPSPFRPTRWDVDFVATTPTKPGFTAEKLAKYFPDDELLAKPEELALAMGEVKVKPRTKRAADLAQKQARIWEQFRARNHDYMKDVAAAEREEWLAANSIPVSELYTVLPDGTALGQGMLPKSIPAGTLRMLNGRPVTTLGSIISKLSSVRIESGTRGISGIRITGDTKAIAGSEIRVPFPKKPVLADLLRWRVNRGELTRAELAQEGRMIAELSDADSKTYYDVLADPKRKAKYVVEDLRGEDLSDLAQEAGTARMTVGGKVTRADELKLDENGRVVGINFKTAEAKALAKKMKARGFEIEPDRYPVPLQAWLVSQLDEIGKRVGKEGVTDKRLLDQRPIDDLANDLFNAPGSKLKSMADARMVASLGRKAITQLAKRPGKRYFVRAPGMQMGRTPLGEVPLWTDVTKRETNTGDFALQNANFGADKRPFTGTIGDKRNRRYVSQTTAQGKDQMASVAIARDAIGAISEKITAGEFVASAEQAQLLGRILRDLGVAVADNASPQKIFKMFAERAPKRYEEVIEMLESAAKETSLVGQMRMTFKLASEENISIMEAVARMDAADAQGRIKAWSQKALADVDSTCMFAGVRTPAMLLRDIMLD